MDLTPRFIDWLTDQMSCKQFARHVASEVDPLPGGWTNRFHFWRHWAICPFCRRYWEEVKAIGEVQRHAAALRHHPAVRIPEIQNRIKANLRSRFA
jgi:hypothetical protein